MVNLRINRMHLAVWVFCGLVLLAECVVLLVGGVKMTSAKKALIHEQQKLSRLLNRSPYPSEKNVQILECNLDELNYRIGELAAELSRDPFPMESVEAAEFSARAQGVIERFRQRAERAGMQLPESLEAGFAQYASGGAVPEPEHVPRLSRQLYSVERVANVLVQSGVTSIDSLSREDFENRDEAEPMRRRRPGGDAAAARKEKPRPLMASEVGKDQLYFIERIGVSFTAREAEVWRVLDLFASDDHFMVVSEFSHQTANDILAYNPDALKNGNATDDETLRYLAEGILVGEKALSRPERIISGDELVEVRMTIDVYNFDPKVVQ
ncbi:Amuc_1100 family pilus-like protein [Pontiellaceae bacterium B12219]|nr:Amuc_1100 family pilus-like protein [Pontiellaceae bacterium B12219]